MQNPQKSSLILKHFIIYRTFILIIIFDPRAPFRLSKQTPKFWEVKFAPGKWNLLDSKLRSSYLRIHALSTTSFQKWFHPRDFCMTYINCSINIHGTNERKERSQGGARNLSSNQGKIILQWEGKRARIPLSQLEQTFPTSFQMSTCFPCPVAQSSVIWNRT